MAKKTRKCPQCGATMGIDVKYCRKCRAKLDSGRVEVLSTPVAHESRRYTDSDDALRNLPKPVRPVEEDASRSGDGFFAPETENKRSHPGLAGDTPRPVSTARGAGAAGNGGAAGGPGKNNWRMAAVLAAIGVIIAIAVVLVIKLNAPADSVQTSRPFETVAPAASASPEPEAIVTPPVTQEPDAAFPQEAEPPAVFTPIPAEAEPVVTPTPTQDPGYSVTEANDTVYITGSTVNIRSGPGTDYNALGSETRGYELRRTGHVDNGWSRVQYNGGEAFVRDDFLSTDKPSSTSAPSYSVSEASGTVKVRTGANLRSGPGTNYGVITTVAEGTELTRTGTSGGWTRVSYNSQTAFISTDLLVNNGLDVDEVSGTVTITGNNVRIRSGAGTNYDRLGAVDSGTTLTVTGETTGETVNGTNVWYLVTYNGKTGYVSAAFAKKS